MNTRKYTVHETSDFAHQMRMKPTRTEGRLYSALTNALATTTARVHLQHVIGPYIADLYIPYAQLIIEADGASHAGRKDYDERRESYMRSRGYRTLRFSNIQIWQDCDAVIREILSACGELKPFIPGEVKITYCPPRYASGHKTRRNGKPRF
jgi:primosomal protein N' (replication factor Y)